MFKNVSYPATPTGIDIFERANEHLKNGVLVLQNDKEYEEGKLKDEKEVESSVRAPSIESVKH